MGGGRQTLKQHLSSPLSQAQPNSFAPDSSTPLSIGAGGWKWVVAIGKQWFLCAAPSSSHFSSALACALQGPQLFRSIWSATEPLFLLLLFWPLCSHCCFLLFYSLLYCLCGVFCPFKSMFPQRCYQLFWWAQLCPVVSLSDPGLFPMGSLAQIPSYAWNLLGEVSFVKGFWNLKHFILYFETVMGEIWYGMTVLRRPLSILKSSRTQEWLWKPYNPYHRRLKFSHSSSWMRVAV